MSTKTKRLATAILFGVIIFVAKAFIPSPLNKMLVGIQALVLALGALLYRSKGATFISLIGGILTALWNIAFAPFTLFFALLYGLLVDFSFLLLKISAHVAYGKTLTIKLVTAMTVCTLIVGLASYYVTVHLTGLLPRSLSLEIMILVAGTINGAVAGYLASLIWNNYLIIFEN
jgi:hypothetical protein